MEKYISVNKLNIKSVHYYDATVMTVVYYNDEIQTPLVRLVTHSQCVIVSLYDQDSKLSWNEYTCEHDFSYLMSSTKID